MLLVYFRGCGWVRAPCSELLQQQLTLRHWRWHSSSTLFAHSQLVPSKLHRAWMEIVVGLEEECKWMQIGMDVGIWGQRNSQINWFGRCATAVSVYDSLMLWAVAHLNRHCAWETAYCTLICVWCTIATVSAEFKANVALRPWPLAGSSHGPNSQLPLQS